MVRTAILVEFPGFVMTDHDVSDTELDLLSMEDRLIVLAQHVVVVA